MSVLAGRRVLDLSREPAGMFCALLLKWLGAEVTVVAPPGDDRPVRWEPVTTLDGGRVMSLRYLHYNHGKLRVEVDLRAPAGRRWLLEAVERADVLVEDWGGLGAFEGETGLTWGALRRANPALVFCRLSPFGQTGPYAGLSASDLTVQAASGLLSLTGEPDRYPLRAGEEIAWTLAGLHAAVGAALALVKATRSGVGEEVDVSAQAAVAVTLEAPHGRVVAGAPASRQGSRHYVTCPCNIYRAKDGWVGITANQDPQIAAIVEAVSGGRPTELIPPVADLRRDPALADRLEALLADLMKDWPVAGLVERSRERGLLLAKVNVVADLVTDPHILARGALQRLDGYPGSWRDVASPFRFRPAPSAGTSDSRHPGAKARPLEGITVLDFSWAWAGPYCTKILAAGGAEVVKIENPKKPDVFRRYPPYLGSGVENECSAFFADQNWGKKSVLLDMKDPASVEPVRRFLRTADVLVENFRPRVMASWGFGYEDVARINPRIVYASVSGFGQSGPYRDRPAYGALMESEGGLASLIGYAPDHPYRSGTSLPDPILGAAAALAIAAGLGQSLGTGRGVHLDLAMMDTTLAFLGSAVLAWTALGVARERWGNLSWAGAPEGCYPCQGRDEWVALSVREEEDWRGLAAVIGEPGLGSDPAYGSAAARLERLGEIEARIERWSRGRTKREAAEMLWDKGVSAFPVLTLADLVTDRQLDVFGTFPTIRHPEMGTVKVLGVPFRMSGAAWLPLAPPPLLGQHTREILARLRGGA